jgi:hypothetical protein
VNIVNRSRSRASEIYWKPLFSSPTRVEGLGDILEALVQLSDPVFVADPGVVEEHLIGDLALPDRGHRLDLHAGAIHRHQEERDPLVLGCIGIGPRAEPVPFGEVRRGGEDLLTVETPAIAVADGLERHRGRIGAGLGLAVSDRELDVVLEDLGKELLLELLAASTDQRLSDDADALADLRTARAGQALVQKVLVDALAFAPSVLLRPGHAQPTALTDLLHEGAPLGGIHQLRHVLSTGIHHLRVVVLLEEPVDLLQKLVLLLRKLEVHDPILLPL